MDQFEGRVAVITGASLGLGRALAWACARLGMRVALIGSNRARIEDAARELRAGVTGVEALPVQADVARPAAMEAAAEQVWAAFGGAHLLIQNAGVMLLGSPLENSLEEWQWLMGVNYWGVLHGMRAFVPRMLAQGEPGHVVTVASSSGLTSGAAQSAYHASKHAAFALTESLYYTLKEQEARIGVSVAAPGWVRTQMGDLDRSRPAELTTQQRSPQQAQQAQRFQSKVSQGMDPDVAAEKIFAGIRAGQLYILTHPETKPGIRARFENILDGRNPLL